LSPISTLTLCSSVCLHRLCLSPRMKVLLFSLTVLSSLVVVLHGRPQFPQLFNQAINALPPRLSNILNSLTPDQQAGLRSLVQTAAQNSPCGPLTPPSFCTCQNGQTFETSLAALSSTNFVPGNPSTGPCGDPRSVQSCTCPNGNTFDPKQEAQKYIPFALN